MAETTVENNATTPEVKDVKTEASPVDEKKPVADNEAAAEKKEEASEKKEEEKEVQPPAPKFNVHKQNFEKDVVYLYQYSRTPTIPSVSPYCLKVETFLRLADVKYECVDHKMKFRSKKGQLPFVELNGEEIADSAIIVEELTKKFGQDLDARLTSEQRVLSHALIQMIENRLVWVVIWWRTKNPDLLIKGYKVNLQYATGSRLPNPLLGFLFKFSFGRRGNKKLKAQGMGVHSEEEVMRFGESDLKTLSEALADKPYYFGDEPTLLDVVSFAHLSQIYFIEKDVGYALREYMAESCQNLVGHVNRMKERCFPDWEQLCDISVVSAKETKEKEAAQDEKEVEKGDEKEPSDKDIEKEKADDKEKEIEKESDENKDKENEAK